MIHQNSQSPPQNQHAKYTVNEEEGSFSIAQGRAGALNRRVGNCDGDFIEHGY